MVVNFAKKIQNLTKFILEYFLSIKNKIFGEGTMQDELNNNYKLSEYIEELASKIEVNDDNKRNMLLIGFFNNARINFYSMNLLIEKRLYNSAFALVRVFFENIIKARYIYMFFDDAKIEKMYGKDDWDSIFKKEPNLGDMCKAIDTEIGENFYETIKNNAYKKMNDFTHIGAYQISSNFNVADGLVEPNFREEFIQDALKGNFELMKTFSLFSLEILGFDNGFIAKDEMDKLLSKTIA